MFEAVVSQEGTVRQIGLNGEFDLEEFPQAAEVFANRSDECSAVEVGLRGLTFMDSSGIRKTARFDRVDLGAEPEVHGERDARIVFHSVDQGLWMVNAAGGQLHQVVASGFQPAFMPGGTHIVYDCGDCPGPQGSSS